MLHPHWIAAALALGGIWFQLRKDTFRPCPTRETRVWEPGFECQAPTERCPGATRFSEKLGRKENLPKRFYILFVARGDDGQLRKIPVPARYLYVLVVGAVVGALGLTGIASSYVRMLLKVSGYNEVRAVITAGNLPSERLFARIPEAAGDMGPPAKSPNSSLSPNLQPLELISVETIRHAHSKHATRRRFLI